jgi:hypothetical protein
MTNFSPGEEAYMETTEINGALFTSQQSVSGDGIMNSYRCIQIYPITLESHSKGSGFYDSDSAILEKRDADFVSSLDGYVNSGREVEFNDNVSSAYFPTTIDFGGSFHTGPIKSTWSDYTSAGNIGGMTMSASFDDVRSQVKEMSTKISGEQKIDDIYMSSGNFEASMKLNSAFNGTVQLNMISNEPNKSVPTKTLEEYYRGAFSLINAMAISERSTSLGMGNNEVAIESLPCCFAGYIDMDPLGKENQSTECIFNCSLGAS